MPFINYSSLVLRASAATSGASEQDAAQTLPESVSSIYVICEKTAEANADNLLTVRLQARVNGIWFDVGWSSITTTQVLSTATDLTLDVVRKNNLVDVNTADPTYQVVGHYEALPSNVVRIASISSGSSAANTFSAVAHFKLNTF